MTASDGSRRTKTVRKRLADGTIRVYRYDLDAIAQRKVAKAQERGWHQLAMLYYAHAGRMRVHSRSLQPRLS